MTDGVERVPRYAVAGLQKPTIEDFHTRAKARFNTHCVNFHVGDAAVSSATIFHPTVLNAAVVLQ